MPTPAEKQALIFFAIVATLGAGVRLLRSESSRPELSPADSAALSTQLAAVDSARSAAKEQRKRRPPRKRASTTMVDSLPPVRIDLDRAAADEIAELPWIGPVLAARIVADRDSLGPFGSIEELERVRGIGPAIAKRLAPLVTFSLSPRPSNAVSDRRIRPVGRPRRRAGGS